MKRDLKFEEVYPYPREKVWKALTDSEILAQWLMENDFKPEVGHKFTVDVEPLNAVVVRVRNEDVAGKPRTPRQAPRGSTASAQPSSETEVTTSARSGGASAIISSA